VSKTKDVVSKTKIVSRVEKVNPFVPRERTLASRPEHLRQENAKAVLRLLRMHNPCSKADLMRRSGLSAPTVSNTIAYLQQLDLVEHVGEGASTGGRPPTLLRFKSSRGYIAGVDVGGTRLRVALADLNGDIVAEWETEFAPEQKTPVAVCNLILTGLKSACKQRGITLGSVLRIAAGTPGITDVDAGLVVSAPNLQDWQSVPLKAMLEQKTGIASMVENDTNLAAMGEHWRGAAIDVDNFVFIGIGTGIGAGIFLRGLLHHGANWSAGEIGYLKVNGKSQERLHVYEPGELERAIGGAGIESLWRNGSNGRNGSHAAGLHARQIFDLAGAGDAAALKIVNRVAQTLAGAVANISLVLNPELIILGGGVGAHPVLCEATKKLVDKNEFARPRLTTSTLGTQAQIYGTIYTALTALESTLV
jgi:glucokinase